MAVMTGVRLFGRSVQIVGQRVSPRLQAARHPIRPGCHSKALATPLVDGIGWGVCAIGVPGQRP